MELPEGGELPTVEHIENLRSATGSERVADIRAELQESMDADMQVFRDEDSIRRALAKIEELRAKAEAALGDKFDIKDFHTVVLGSGAVPLDVLGDLVDAWIAKGGGAPA